ncbi:NUDIX domain-containing protein [Frigoribacterium sp. 2-23]|uniref:NUDIX domain-containing protein n=1 Tax=Frigoribacterium sp. 2-23 TaxID=3415006 RepID=UPI003C6EB17E
MTVHGPADGWVESPEGVRFWGRAGAAGLLAVDRRDRVLLQHRAVWSHHGGTWGLPGGARQFDESAVEGALRESSEEAAVPPEALALSFASVVDLGFWSYTTVVAHVVVDFEPRIADAESSELRWVPADEVSGLPLHPGFAGSWPELRRHLDTRTHVVVDAANVVGSRPDGWWRDRVGATGRVIDLLEAQRPAGVPAAWFDGSDSVGESIPGTPSRWWPGLSVVVEGQARQVADRPASPIDIVRAAGSGDDAVVERVAALRTHAVPSRIVVVTADRGLRDRVEAEGAVVVGPGRLLGSAGADVPDRAV